MKSLLVAIAVAITCGAAGAQTPGWQPDSRDTQVAIWPAGKLPDARPAPGPESATQGAGKSYLSVTNVSQPTMTVYSPVGTNTGAAVVVFPGGGYQILAIDLEGTEICDWLVSRGITAVLLKYRVPNSGPHWDAKCRCHVTPHPLTALQDAQRAIGIVRAHAAQWQVDPHKVGVIGFSA